MAQGIVTQDRRAVRAAGIVERQECEMQDNGTWHVRDTETGSGEWHVTTAIVCDCWDFRRRCVVCKHIAAVRHEEHMLEVYAATWNARAEQARAVAGPQCPTCGAGLEARQYHIGGRGYMAFMVCRRDESHRAQPA